jgi:hypothetical protein
MLVEALRNVFRCQTLSGPVCASWVARQDVDGQRGVCAKEVNDCGDERVVDVVVLKQITGDEEGVGLVLGGEFEGTFKCL